MFSPWILFLLNACYYDFHVMFFNLALFYWLFLPCLCIFELETKKKKRIFSLYIKKKKSILQISINFKIDNIQLIILKFKCLIKSNNNNLIWLIIEPIAKIILIEVQRDYFTIQTPIKTQVLIKMEHEQCRPQQSWKEKWNFLKSLPNDSIGTIVCKLK